MSNPNRSVPAISVLITTFNRKNLLKRCLDRVLGQTFTDFEVVVIDDCSSDGTETLMRSYTDPRIRYFRNEQNMGAEHGDRVHIKRFVHELSRGKYFIYVCDDDYWVSPDLLSKQIAYFEQYPSAVMVTGSQLSYFLSDDETAPFIDAANLNQYMEYIEYVEYLEKRYGPIERVVTFFKNVFPRAVMTSDEFLEYFSEFPITSNIIGGARLYNKELFIRSGALQSATGSKWQAGYELSLGPACYGECIYINEPCILTEIRQKNASFNRTQREHYFDSIDSINHAFEKPLQDWRGTPRESFLKKIKASTIENLGRTFMSNTLVIRRYGQLNMCTGENIQTLVTAPIIFKTRKVVGARFPMADIKTMILISLPGPLLSLWDIYRRLVPKIGFKIVTKHRLNTKVLPFILKPLFAIRATFLKARYRLKMWILPFLPMKLRLLWNRYRVFNPKGGPKRPIGQRIKFKFYPFLPQPLLAVWRRVRRNFKHNASLPRSTEVAGILVPSQGNSMRQKIFISAAIWGHEYVASFVEFSLATQLSQGNIPKLAEDFTVIYQIITTQDDKDWLEQQPLMKKLQGLSTIQWDLIDELCPEVLVPGEFSPNKYEFLTALQNFAMSSAIGSDFLILNYADFVWADSSMPNLINKFGDDTDAVLSFCLPVDRDGGIKEIKQFAREHSDGSGVISLSPRRTVDIALNNLHRETKLRFYEDPAFTVAPTYILWPVEDEGLIITAYHQTMLAFRVRPDDPFYYNGVLTNSLDGFHSAIMGENSKVVHADNSDEIFIFSLYDTILDSSIGGKSPNNLEGYTRDDSLKHCLKSIPAGQRQFALKPIEVRRNYATPEKWDQVKDCAREALEKLHRETAFDLAAYNTFYVGGYSVGFKSLSSTRSTRNLSQKKSYFRAWKRAWARLGRKARVAFITHFIPKNAALNSNFSRWRSSYFQYVAGIWLDLPARNWIGHFDGGAQGNYQKSSVVPDGNSRYSLLLEGGEGGSTVNFGQRIKASALHHIRQRNCITCSGYVRKEGSADSMVYVYLLVPDKRDDFSSYAHVQNIFNGFRIKRVGEWQYFEARSIDIGWIEHFPNGAMIYFAVSGLNSPQDKVYFSQIRFEAGYDVAPFKPRADWQELFLSTLYFPFLSFSIKAFKVLLRKEVNLKRMLNDPFVKEALSGLTITPLAKSTLFGWADERIDIKESITLLYYGRTEHHIAKIKQHISPIVKDRHEALDGRTAAYLWIGILPERIAGDIKNPLLFARMLAVAEEALRSLIDKAPHYAEGHRALGRNLWLQSRVDEAFVQFRQAQNLTQTATMPEPGAKSISLTGYPDMLIKTKILTGDTRPYHLMVSEDPVLNKEFFDYNRAFFDYCSPYLELDFPSARAKSHPAGNAQVLHPSRDAGGIQCQWEAEGRGPLFTLKEEHRQLLSTHKTAWGMKEKDWFVCLETQSVGDIKCRPQDFRYTPIEDYYAAIEAVVDAGGWVIRMGDSSMIPLDLSRTGINTRKVIDYAHYPQNSAELDVALCSACSLFISASSKMRVIAQAFGRSVCSVNCPIYCDFAWHPSEVFIPMLYYSLYNHTMLPMEELLASDMAHGDHKLYLTAGRIALLRNTPDEIAQTVMEVLRADHYDMTSGEAARLDFDRLNRQYGRGIFGQIGRYFAAKHRAKLFPQPIDARKAHVA